MCRELDRSEFGDDNLKKVVKPKAEVTGRNISKMRTEMKREQKYNFVNLKMVMGILKLLFC